MREKMKNEVDARVDKLKLGIDTARDELCKDIDKFCDDSLK